MTTNEIFHEGLNFPIDTTVELSLEENRKKNIVACAKHSTIYILKNSKQVEDKFINSILLPDKNQKKGKSFMFSEAAHVTD